MKVEYSKAEMLELWKRRHLLVSPRTDGVVTRHDNVEVDAMCIEAMRLRYVELLATAPVRLLVPQDVALNAKLARTYQGTGYLTVPDNVVRVLWVKLSGWERAAQVTEADPALRRLEGNRYACGGVAAPVAVTRSKGAVELFALPYSQSLPLVESVTAVVDPGPELYVMDEELLGSF